MGFLNRFRLLSTLVCTLTFTIIGQASYASDQLPEDLQAVSRLLSSMGISHEFFQIQPQTQHMDEEFVTIYERPAAQPSPVDTFAIMARRLLIPGHANPKFQEEAYLYFLNNPNPDIPLNQFLLGICLFEGKGVEISMKNRKLAMDIFRKGASTGYLPSQLALGYLLMEGLHGEDDSGISFLEGLHHLEQAAKKGADFANRYLGILYYDGEKVKEDQAKSINYFSSIKTDPCMAELVASHHLLNGDYVKAHKYYKLAVTLGSKSDSVMDYVSEKIRATHATSAKTKQRLRANATETEKLNFQASSLRQTLKRNHQEYESLRNVFEMLIKDPIEEDPDFLPKEKLHDLDQLWVDTFNGIKKHQGNLKKQDDEISVFGLSIQKFMDEYILYMTHIIHKYHTESNDDYYKNLKDFLHPTDTILKDVISAIHDANAIMDVNLLQKGEEANKKAETKTPSKSHPKKKKNGKKPHRKK